MSITLYKSCIQELEIPPNKPRKLDNISGYLKSLKNFMLLFRNQKDVNKEILDKLSTVMKLRKIKRNEVIVNEGEKGKEFFILLKGKVCVLTPKVNEYYMSDEEYICYLFQLRLNNQYELIKKCISLNQSIYPISEDNFDIFVYNLTLGKTINESYSKNRNLIQKSKNVYEHICKQNNDIKSTKKEGVENKQKIIISPKQYIIQNSVPDEVIRNTSLIQHYLKLLESGEGKREQEEIDDISEEKSNQSIDEEKDKKLLNNRNKVFIPTHEIYGDLEIGTYFGEMALEAKGSGKRHASLIAIEDCYLGVIDKKDYFFFLHCFIEKAQNKYINFISTFYIFKNLSINVWEKKYMTLFINRIYEKDFLLLKEGEKIDQIYFTYKGEYELTTNKNLIGVNELIIHYRKIMLKLLSTSKNNTDNKKMKKECDYKEEIKENENFIMNKKFHGEKFKKMVFDKNIIKLGIFSKREIIGLLDIYSHISEKDNINNTEDDNLRIKKFKMISLFNCKCISCNCEVYSFPLNKFKDMCENEDKVGELTNELEIQKISYMIKRLKHYKEYLFESMYKKENENKKEIKIINNNNINRGIKNKFEPVMEYSNINLKNGVLNNNIPIQKFINKNNYRKRISNSYTHFVCLNGSYDRNMKKSKKNNLSTSTNLNFNKKKERTKIKQKLLPLPAIDDMGKSNEIIYKNSNDNPKYNTERKAKTSQKSRIIFSKKEENTKYYANTRNYFLENNRIKQNLKLDNDNSSITKNFLSKTNNQKSSFINIDKVRDILIQKRIIKKQNWVSRVLVKNLVYNHLFDRYAFSSPINNSKNNFNNTQYNLKKNLNKFKDFEKININDKANSKDKTCYNDKNINKTNYNKTEPNIFMSKGYNYFSNKSNKNMIKNIKMKINHNQKNEKETNDNKANNNNRIYDALIYDNFNNYFNENLYKNFFEE